MSRDTCDEIAAILIPWPDRDEAGSDSLYNALCEDVYRDRQEAAHSLRLASEASETDDSDPVIACVQHARMKMLQAEQEMRRLIAYAREFTRPRPYTLADLAEAAGMSISGIRTAYDREEVTYVAEATGLRQPQ